MTIDQLNFFSQYVAPSMFSLALAILAPLSVAFGSWILSKLPDAQRKKVAETVQRAVFAVEQTQSMVPGPVKKAEANRVIGVLLSDLGIKTTPLEVDTLIESTCLAFNQAKMSNIDITKKLPAVK